MSWEAIGAIGQAVSALALVVVIVQLRLSTAETLRSIRQNRKEDERRTLSENAQSEWLCSVIAKGTKAFDTQPDLTELMEPGLTEAFFKEHGLTVAEAWVRHVDGFLVVVR